MKILLAVVAVLFLAGAAQAAWGGPCPIGGWKVYKDTVCLKLFQQKDTWKEARRQCAFQQPGSDLVRVDSEDKNRFIHTMVHAERPFLKCGIFGMDSYWIGANDKDKEGNFIWNESGEKVDYKNWGVMQPNNLFNEDCVEMEFKDGEWDDSDCDNTQCFVCEKPVAK